MINFRPLDAAITTRGALENVLQSQRVYQFRRRHFFYSPLCGPGARCADRCAGRLRPGQHPWPVGRPAAAPLGRPYSPGCGSTSRDRHADVELCFAAKALLWAYRPPVVIRRRWTLSTSAASVGGPSSCAISIGVDVPSSEPWVGLKLGDNPVNAGARAYRHHLITFRILGD